MTLDEAKYKLSQKIADVKKLLRSRKIELESNSNRSLERKIQLNGFHDGSTYKQSIEQGAYRDIFSLMNYIYMCELDEAKRRQLALFIIMQFSFKSYKNNEGYDAIVQSLTSNEKQTLTELERYQEDTRRYLIGRLKDEFLRDDKSISDLKELKKLSWNGTRKQLAELFVELEQKGWVTINDGERKPVCNTIAHLFNILKADKIESINEESFYTTFRPNPEHDKPKYPYKLKFNKIYSAQYITKFDGIKEF